jgi:hypothetical protein
MDTRLINISFLDNQQVTESVFDVLKGEKDYRDILIKGGY